MTRMISSLFLIRRWPRPSRVRRRKKGSLRRIEISRVLNCITVSNSRGPLIRLLLLRLLLLQHHILIQSYSLNLNPRVMKPKSKAKMTTPEQSPATMCLP
ncbi:hypothetical protein BDV11DRAFT_195359 [Aspergillus similis]